MIERQYEKFSTLPGYGAGEPGFGVLNPVTIARADPGESRLAIDAPAIESFLVARGANPEHVKYGAVVPYKPGELAKWGRTAYEHQAGFVDSSLAANDERGTLRFPLIFVLDAPKIVSEKAVNATVRHELGHLTLPEKRQPYQNNSVLTGTRAGALAVGVACALAARYVWDQDYLLQQYIEGDSVYSLTAQLAGPTLGAAAGTLVGMAPKKMTASIVHAFTPDEYKASAFARRHKTFNPIAYT